LVSGDECVNVASKGDGKANKEGGRARAAEYRRSRTSNKGKTTRRDKSLHRITGKAWILSVKVFARWNLSGVDGKS
jgi:hypothetical protein